MNVRLTAPTVMPFSAMPGGLMVPAAPALPADFTNVRFGLLLTVVFTNVLSVASPVVALIDITRMAGFVVRSCVTAPWKPVV